MKQILIGFLLVSALGFSQNKINTYKYVIVPKKFESFKKADQYQINSLSKFLFNKYGFTAFLSDEVFPEDLAQNRCLALTANLKDDSGMFTTKTIVELKDCANNLVFTSTQGTSKIKDYKRAYHEAIRSAFISVKNLNYTYNPANIQQQKDNGFKEIQVEKSTKEVSQRVVELSGGELFAKPQKFGYQLINADATIVFEVLKTDLANVFIVKNKNGILHKKKDSWILEYYENEIKMSKKVVIKF